MKVCILAVPYDSGRRGERMGAGPLALLDRRLEDDLARRGHRVRAVVVELAPEYFAIEVQAAFELNRSLATEVRRAVDQGEVPLVLSGNCNGAVGAMAGLGGERTAVAWYDAHGDINTPESTGTGYLDGMGLAILVGWCWRRLAATIPGFAPVAEENALLLGVRDFDSPEAELVDRSKVRALSPAQVRSELEPVLEEVADRVDGIYVHLDLDVLDPAEGRANMLEVPDGLSVAELERSLLQIKQRLPIRGVGLGSYDPAYDDQGRIADAAARLLISALSE